MMPVRLDTRAADFAERFRAFLDTKREISEDVEQAARAIIADVIARGDDALIELTRRFDRVDIAAGGLRVSAGEIAATIKSCDADALAAGRRPLCRCTRRGIGAPLDRHRGSRPLCAGRDRRLSVLGADERGAGE